MFIALTEDNRISFVSEEKITEDQIEDSIDIENMAYYIYDNGKFRLMTEEEKEEFYPTTEQSNISDNELLKAQIQAISDRNDFIEDCIAEMAMEVYQ